MNKTVFPFIIILLLTACFKPEKPLEIEVETVNPWTNLDFNAGNSSFSFAIVGDRAGGTRLGVFDTAVTKLNFLQPEFVMSVGDLTSAISYPPAEFTLEEQLVGRWTEFDAMVNRLHMPFFYVGGNADMVHYDTTGAVRGNRTRADKWNANPGRSYYSFRYKGVLFLVLDTDDPPGEPQGMISEAQLDWLKLTLNTNPDPSWTLLFLHRPLWLDQPELWDRVEQLLGNTKRTVFSGHHHTYKKNQINGFNYYTLATTGGGSDLSGIANGKFDHVTWVTMKNEGPVIANLILSGIYGDDPPSEATSIPENTNVQ